MKKESAQKDEFNWPWKKVRWTICVHFDINAHLVQM